jgi:sterol desaturase/sphingolipid hydroxylase (fatty acid hydroxylase superfamily)
MNESWKTVILAPTRMPAWLGPLVVSSTFAGLFWLERRYPLRQAKPEPDHQRVPRNFMIAAITGLVIRRCERPLVEPLAHWVERRQAGLLPRLGLPSPLAEKVLGIVLLDYSLYAWHILLHRVPWLWRSHIVHHADLVLDTSTALRFHWLEFLASIPWRLAQVVVLGIPPPTLALWQKLTLIEVLFHHANLRLPSKVERQLSRFVMTPRLHGIHHSTDAEQSHTNFSSGLTIWDVLHRTLKTGVRQEEIDIGVSNYHSPHELTLLNLLALPLRRQRSGQMEENAP